MSEQNLLGALTTYSAGAAGDEYLYRLEYLEKSGVASGLERLPFSIKVLLEAVLRNADGYSVTQDDVARLANWRAQGGEPSEVPFKPARVLLQDFTGVPTLVDLAAMREAVYRLGGDPKRINPLVPVDLVIDHSVQVDYFGTAQALGRNAELEFSRNRERYEFLRWGQNALQNFRVVPPATGIVHQVNLEYLAKGVLTRMASDGKRVAMPDTVVGTDSHTTMINGLGVLGWGVGGIEAEAVMLGQPIFMLAPQVIGFRLHGHMREGVTATDLTLTVTQMLRKKGVVDKFVEFFGPGLSSVSLADRATIANMAPEYGATCSYFPVDAETLVYLRRTGRTTAEVERVERYTKEQGLFRTDATADPQFTDILELDLDSVLPSLAGPKRPQDRVLLSDMQSAFKAALTAPVKERGYGMAADDVTRTVEVEADGEHYTLGHGAVVIAAITSCTNTSNPQVMLGAGVLAKKAVEAGLHTPAHVKTSLAPGSKVVTEYLTEAGVLPYLEQLGFNVVGYGCTTCIAEGTPVLLGNGTARRIEQMPAAGGAVVFGPIPGGELGLATQMETMNQGVRACVELTLQDGRTLVCTPDHKILCADGRWVRADELDLSRDRVVVGLEAPLDEPSGDEDGYVLEVGTLCFTTETPEARERLLAFARLLGHLLGDGSISALGQGRMTVGQAVDREVVLNDVALLTGKRPAATQYDERKWTIVLPKALTDAISALPGVRVGRRIDQAPQLPDFVLEANCPVAVVREYLAGVFGADGQAPILKRLSARETDAILDAPGYAQSAKPEHVAQLKVVMRQMIGLLARCGVQTESAGLYEYPVRRAVSSHPAAKDGTPRVEVRLSLPDGLSFVERVGFRYCVDKALRASAAAVYWRTVNRIHQQRLWMSDELTGLHESQPALSFSQARVMAGTTLQARETPVFPHYSLLAGHDRFSRLPQPTERKFRPLHRDSCGFPSPVELLTQMGVREWFAPLRARNETDYSKRYCVDKHALTLPTFALAVLDRRSVGHHRVFDISVNDLHAFIAGTVAVHNCIGNSGPLPAHIAQAIQSGNLVASAVLSGNRNFEGRVNPHTKANYLASPPLVVAYALAGTTDIDLTTEPLGTGKDGQPVFLRDIWPSQAEVAELMARAIHAEMFLRSYGNVFSGNLEWNAIGGVANERFPWDPDSTYVQEPPYFENLTLKPLPLNDIHAARVLAIFGDSVTTDHISPAGDIPDKGPAGAYLKEHGIVKADFNSFGARRGNHFVMMRGTFANIRIKNLMLGGVEGGMALHVPSGETATIFEISARYQAEGTPLIVIAGKEYGTGSSRDWAAKGPLLLGVRAVIAESFERIHRSNLVGMGILPLVFQDGATAESLGLTGREQYTIEGLAAGELTPRQTLMVKVAREDGTTFSFPATARLDTPVDIDYYKNGGILQTVLRNLL